jgi:hypothetical protein
VLTVYVSIGNSDDKLSQADWATFHSAVNDVIRHAALQMHGAWTSPSTDPWQNACWCFEVNNAPGALYGRQWLRNQLANFAKAYQQDSIAWAEAPKTEFLC